MSRSPYIDSVVLTNKHSGKRTQKVQAFVIHHMAARWTGKRCAEYFRDTPSRQASANYCIGYDGDVALNVEEENRAWTSSSNWADQRAITYELANSKIGHPWPVSNITISKAIVMLAEQHKRYGLKKASYTGDTSGTLWRHDWFAETNCPGPYLGNLFSYIADEINKILDSKPTVAGAQVSKPASPVKEAGIVKTYAEHAVFTPNDTIIVRDAPSTTAKEIARYKTGELVIYHTVHMGNGYVWLQYDRSGGGQGYIPCRTYQNGQVGELWGKISDTAPASKPLKEYVQLSKNVSSWRIYPLGVAPVAGKEKGFLNPAKFGGLVYEVEGYEDNGKTAIIRTGDFGKGKIYLDSDAKVYKQ